MQQHMTVFDSDGNTNSVSTVSVPVTVYIAENAAASVLPAKNWV